MQVAILVTVLLLGFAGRGLAAANDPSPCREHQTQPHWQVFVDQKDRFCFEYPPEYRVAPPVFANAISGSGLKFLGRLDTKPGPTQTASAQDEEDAVIDVFAREIPFQPDALNRFAPMGMEDYAPKPVHAAHENFYYYGPGGGGVDYPDAFYFGLRGQTFSIEFYGPFTRDKTPDKETKEIEPKVLASFRLF